MIPDANPTPRSSRSAKTASLAHSSFSQSVHDAFEAYFRAALHSAVKPTVEERNLIMLSTRICLQYPHRAQEVLSCIASDTYLPKELPLALALLTDCSQKKGATTDAAEFRYALQAGKDFVAAMAEASSGKGYTLLGSSPQLVTPEELQQAASFILLIRDAAFWSTEKIIPSLSFPIPEIEKERILHQRSDPKAPSFSEPYAGAVPLMQDPSPLPGFSYQHQFLYEELILISWEEEFQSRELESHDLDLCADFFEMRGKPEMAQKAVAQHLQKAIGFECLFDRYVRSEAARRYLSEEARLTLTFERHLKEVLGAGDTRIEAVGAALTKQGFDLEALPFDRLLEKHWHQKLSQDERNKLGDPCWHEKIKRGEIDSGVPSTALAADEKITIDSAVVQQAVKKLRDHFAQEPSRYELEAFADLLEGLAEIRVDQTSIPQSVLFRKLSSLNPSELFLWAREGHSSEDLSRALVYAHELLTQKEAAAELGSGFRSHLGLLIYGTFLIFGNISGAKKVLDLETVKSEISPQRIRAAARLAWFYLTSESIEAYSDIEASDKLELAMHLREHLQGIETASPFFQILDSKPGELSADELKTITALKDLELMESLLARHAHEELLRETLRERYRESLTSDTEFGIFRGIFDDAASSLLQNPVFCSWVSAEDRKNIQDSFMRRCVEEDDEENAASRLVRFALRPEFRPYLPPDFTLSNVIMRLIQEELPAEHWKPLIQEEFALPEADNLRFMTEHQRENYFDIQLLLEQLPPEEKEALIRTPEYRQYVTWYLVGETDCIGSMGALLSYAMLEKARLRDNPELKIPSHVRMNISLDDREKPWEILSRIYEAEAARGAIDEHMLRIGLLNVMTRGNYVHPQRFYPHTDSMLDLLNSPFARFLPRSGPGAIMLRPFFVLHRLMRNTEGKR